MRNKYYAQYRILKLLILGLNKSRCTFSTSELPSEIPRTQNRNFQYANKI